MRTRITDWMLPAIITILALVDGILHLRLIYTLFGGKLWGALSFGAPPAGAPAGSGPPAGGGGGMPQALPFISLPLNELFLLNFIGFMVLAAIFWLVLLRFGRWSWAVDIALIAYTALAIIGWFRVGKPNPQGLGYLSKELEIALIAALLAHLCYTFIRERRVMRLQAA